MRVQEGKPASSGSIGMKWVSEIFFVSYGQTVCRLSPWRRFIHSLAQTDRRDHFLSVFLKFQKGFSKVLSSKFMID